MQRSTMAIGYSNTSGNGISSISLRIGPYARCLFSGLVNPFVQANLDFNSTPAGTAPAAASSGPNITVGPGCIVKPNVFVHAAAPGISPGLSPSVSTTGIGSRFTRNGGRYFNRRGII
ncbi:MAG: hypothetical protein JST22_16140 [Bacteroidetes bacterium]|nr:hypothetical protein [Bacteroidota bacterium]